MITTLTSNNLPALQPGIDVGAVVFQQVRLHEAWDDIEDLIDEHYRAITLLSANKDVALEPNKDTYLNIEMTGAYRVYIVRDKETLAIVGYGGYFVSKSLHYTLSLQAVQDVLYVKPEYRSGWIGYRFLKYIEQCMRNDGVDALYQAVTVAHDYSKLLRRLNYREAETVFIKKLR